MNTGPQPGRGTLPIADQPGKPSLGGMGGT
jgi:hypothetical protein